MKVCPNCQTNNVEGTNFCIRCGTALGAQQSIPASAPAIAQIPAPGFTPASAPVPTPKKPFSIKKAFLLVAALAIVIYAVYAIIMVSNPSLRLLSGLAKFNTGKATVNSTMTVKYKGDNEQLKLMNYASIKLSTAMDMNKMLAESSFDLLYDNKSVAKFSAGLGSEDVFLDPLKLYSKKFYYELDDQTLSVISELQVMYKYIKQANIKFDYNKYAAIEKDILGDNLEGSLGKVTLTMNTELAYEMLIAVLEEARDDEQLMESTRKNAQDIMNKIKKDNHTFVVLFDEEYIQDAIDYVADKDTFADMYQSSIDSALSSLQYQLDDRKSNPEYYVSEPEMVFTFNFGMFQNIKSITCTMNVNNPDTNESVKIVVDSSVKGGAHFTNFKTSGAIDFLDLVADPTQAQSIAEKALKNVITNVKSNKKLTTALEDLTGQDINDLNTYIVDNLFNTY